MPERATVKSRSEKSAEAVVAAGTERRAERGEALKGHRMRQAMRQTSAQAERVEKESGEAALGLASDEASRPPVETASPGSVLLLAALGRENLRRAFKRVRANGGAAGVDGLDIDQTAGRLKTQWPKLREQLLAGTYRPSPVRRVVIGKPDGGERELGIPTVTDRLIQQALLQVLQPILDPTFSEHSYGFRPGRSAHEAVLAARAYIAAGRRIVVDVDLERFFDRVNHDILIDRLGKRIEDAGVIRLIRAYLNSGLMIEGVVHDREEGTPQGGPLSPLLANVLLDEVDKELERRGHCFARYADDCNVYVRSQRAGERVLALLRRCYAKLKLRINEAKSAVGRCEGRKFLGYRFLHWSAGEVRCAVAKKALERFKHRVRALTSRTAGRSMAQVVQRLRAFIPGWRAYFSLAQFPSLWRELDQWVRHRLRALQLKHWQTAPRTYQALRELRVPAHIARPAAAHHRRWWSTSGSLLHGALPIAYFDRLGVPRLS
jgi:RNA-directed DNA polymerase